MIHKKLCERREGHNGDCACIIQDAISEAFHFPLTNEQVIGDALIVLGKPGGVQAKTQTTLTLAISVSRGEYVTWNWIRC